jgi:hypothetical protein
MVHLLLCSILALRGFFADPVGLDAGRLSVTVGDASSKFEYTVKVDDTTWFSSEGDSAGYSYFSEGKNFSNSDSSMVGTILGQPSSGTDATGAYTILSIGWAPAGNPSAGPQWVTSFLAYPARNAIVFRQTWTAATNTTGGSTFPSFQSIGPETLGTLE